MVNFDIRHKGLTTNYRVTACVRVSIKVRIRVIRYSRVQLQRRHALSCSVVMTLTRIRYKLHFQKPISIALENWRIFVLHDLKPLIRLVASLLYLRKSYFQNRLPRSHEVTSFKYRRIFHCISLVFMLAFPPSSQEVRIHYAYSLRAFAKKKANVPKIRLLKRLIVGIAKISTALLKTEKKII